MDIAIGSAVDARLPGALEIAGIVDHNAGIAAVPACVASRHGGNAEHVSLQIARVLDGDADIAVGAVRVAQGIGKNCGSEVGSNRYGAGVGDGDAGIAVLAIGVGAVFGGGEQADAASFYVASVVNGDSGVAAVADRGALDPGIDADIAGGGNVAGIMNVDGVSAVGAVGAAFGSRIDAGECGEIA